MSEKSLPVAAACAGRKIEQVSIAVVTGICQLKCIYCPTHDIRRGKGFVGVDFLTDLLAEVQPKIVNLQGYGEPSLHPEFQRIVRVAKSGGRVVKFFSHLNYWTEELARFVVAAGVNQIIISIDAFEPEKYAAIRRNGSLEELKRGIRHLLHAKRELSSEVPELIFNTVVIRETVDEIDRAIDFAVEVGEGQPIYELVNDYGMEQFAALAETDEQRLREALLHARGRAEALGWARTLQNIDFNLASIRVQNPDQFVCYRPWRLLTVTENGDVVPCGEYHEAQVVFGNVKSTPWREVWDSPEAHAFRNDLLLGRSRLPVCSRCTVNEGATADLFEPWKEVS